jgi:glycosyltransferase involved in cell wall biosynthesis
MPKLSVIIPAYKESHRIGATLEAVHAYLSRQAYDYEILVVNDGSPDNTAEVVRGYEGSVARLTLIDNKENHGKGWVVRQGMLEAKGDVRVFMDADNSTKIDEIGAFFPYFEQGYDAVVGSRRIAGANVKTDQKPLREFLGWCFRTIVHILVPVGVTDTQCGFKAFTARAAEAVFPAQLIFRWAFDVEILALARKNKFRIKEVPITWVNDEGSQMRLSGMVNMLLEVLEVRWNLWTGKYGHPRQAEAAKI